MMDGDVERFTREVFAISPFCHICNTAGVPSMNVPLWWDASGLPIGVIFTSRYGAEATLLRFARQLEEAQPWASRRAPITGRKEAA